MQHIILTSLEKQLFSLHCFIEKNLIILQEKQVHLGNKDKLGKLVLQFGTVHIFMSVKVDLRKFGVHQHEKDHGSCFKRHAHVSMPFLIETC